MNNKKIRMIIVIGALTIITSFLVKGYIDGLKTKQALGLEKNYGESYMTSVLEIGSNSKVNGRVYNVDNIVPAELELVNKLKDEAYTIEKYNTVLEDKINAVRIYAKKSKEYIDITYCKDIDDAKQVFALYEETYEEFYLMAQNVTYVYCISSGEVFDTAGFTSLSNSGIQYINHAKQ